jgi:hypothetical protein
MLESMRIRGFIANGHQADAFSDRSFVRSADITSPRPGERPPGHCRVEARGDDESVDETVTAALVGRVSAQPCPPTATRAVGRDDAVSRPRDAHEFALRASLSAADAAAYGMGRSVSTQSSSPFWFDDASEPALVAGSASTSLPARAASASSLALPC